MTRRYEVPLLDEDPIFDEPDASTAAGLFSHGRPFRTDDTQEQSLRTLLERPESLRAHAFYTRAPRMRYRPRTVRHGRRAGRSRGLSLD